MALAPGIERAEEKRAPSAGALRILRSAANGTLGGIAGTLTMSILMLAARRAGLMGRLPPERITQRLFFRGARRATRQREKNALAALLHLGFGAAGGALFGIASRRLLSRLNPQALGGVGVIYGSLIWFVSYMGWVPALGLLPPAQKDRPDRPVVMVVAHWIYGATLGVLVGLLGRARQER